MIDQLGFYMTRGGRVVEITRILQSQPIAEGYAITYGTRDTFHIWNVDGYSNRHKETEIDIVSFMYGLSSDDYDAHND